MDFEKENDYTTYFFALTTVGLLIKLIFIKGIYDHFVLIGYALTACVFFFVYQFFKLTALKKELKVSDKKLLKKISKDNSTTINVISIFNNAELFEQSKNKAINSKFELAKKSVLFSFYSTTILIACYLIF